MKNSFNYNGIEASLYDFIIVNKRLVYGVFGSATQQNLNAINGLFQGGVLRKKEATLYYIDKEPDYDPYQNWRRCVAHESGYFKELEVGTQFSVMTLKSKTLFSDIYGKPEIIILGGLSKEEAILAWLDKYCPLPIPQEANNHLIEMLSDYFEENSSLKGIKYLEINACLLDEENLTGKVQEYVESFFSK